MLPKLCSASQFARNYIQLASADAAERYCIRETQLSKIIISTIATVLRSTTAQAIRTVSGLRSHTVRFAVALRSRVTAPRNSFADYFSELSTDRECGDNSITEGTTQPASLLAASQEFATLRSRSVWTVFVVN